MNGMICFQMRWRVSSGTWHEVLGNDIVHLWQVPGAHTKVPLVGVRAARDTLCSAWNNWDNFAGAVGLRWDAIVTVLVEAFGLDLAVNNDRCRQSEGSKEESENSEDAEVLHFDLIYRFFSGMIFWFLDLFQVRGVTVVQ